MTVRPQLAALLLTALVLLGAGCGAGDSGAFTAETDDRNYQEGQRLVRQGREAEALSAFLKVIEKRGEQASAESHLEAGLICLNHIKDPIEAIHHFRKYLELQPNAKQAPGVRGLIDTAKREFARTLPAHPQESLSVDAEQGELVRQLQRENDELRAELAAQRTATTTQFLRSSRATVDGGDTHAPGLSMDSIPLITPAPMPAHAPTAGPTPGPVAAAGTRLFSAPGVTAKGNRATPPASPGGRKHTVAAGETLFSISKKYGVTVEELQQANRSIVPSVTAKLPRGAELTIP